MKKTLESFLVLIVLGCFWWVVSNHTAIPAYFLPTPAAVMSALIQNHALLWTAFAATFAEAILGFLLALILALLLGFIGYLCPWFGRLLHPVVIISQALPMLILAPLIVLWLGFGWNAKLVVIVLSLFFPILASFMIGLNQVKPLYLDLAVTMGARRLRLFFLVAFPASLPYLAAGLRVAITWSVLSALIAEWVGGSEGLGFVMQNALSRLDVALLFAALLILVASTLFLYAMMSLLLSSKKYFDGS